VKDVKASLAKWKAAGIEPMKEFKATTLLAPDNVQVRITEDSKLSTPIAADGIVMSVANAAEVSAWYAKWFGAKSEPQRRRYNWRNTGRTHRVS